jgi:hypothetical protein
MWGDTSLLTNTIMAIVNNSHPSFLNKIKDPIFIDNKKTLYKGKNTHKVVYTIIDTNWRCFFKVSV